MPGTILMLIMMFHSNLNMHEQRDLWIFLFLLKRSDLVFFLYYLGNDNLYLLTSSKTYTLRVDLEKFNGEMAFSTYSTFEIGGSDSKYKLKVDGYSGSAGMLLLF